MTQFTFTAERIARTLARVASGESAHVVCNQLGVDIPTFSEWQANYGGLSAREISRLWSLQAGNLRLKQLLNGLRQNSRELGEKD
ncbi:transposase [Pandoraea sputorum]|uniref:transposase n=1 Tax=Pandoraea sputorum TaxID=93222 RepID=UPI003969C5C8